MNVRSSEAFWLQDTESGIRARVCSGGASLMELRVPLADGTYRDVVLGYDDPETYRANEPHLGHTVAPVANRIGGGTFTLNGKTYQLNKNDGENANHGGSHAMHGRLWKVDSFSDNSVTFSYECADGENGFPGPLHMDVTYTVRDRALLIDFHALAAQDTLFNPTNHSYFNLKGQGKGDILDHVLTVYADQITPPGPKNVPEGTFLDVEGTPFDFRTPEVIGARINADEPILKNARGYDQNFVLKKEEPLHEKDYDAHGNNVFLAARLAAPDGSVALEVLTDLPGLQIYTANYLAGEEGKGGVHYQPQSSVCLETQYCPNAINIPSFPHPVAYKAKDLYTRTVYRF